MKQRNGAILFAILVAACASAFGQGKPDAFQSALAASKPHAVQLHLMRASQLCGAVMDCMNADPRRAVQRGMDPCVTDVVGCHMDVSSGAYGQGTSWKVGGAKLSADIGRVTFTVGRHRENLVLSRVPFIEGSYRFSSAVSLRTGILRAHTGPEPHTMLYVSLHAAL